ncbi:MAG: hypothetical protein ACT6FE_07735 [Methanosarcinaceae archaeon]
MRSQRLVRMTRGFDRNAYMGAGHGGISPFEHVTDYGRWGAEVEPWRKEDVIYAEKVIET